MVKKDYLGLNPIKFAGSKFEIGYGYSKFVNLTLNNKKYTPILNGISNTFGVKFEDRIKEKIFCGIEEKKSHLLFFAKSAEVEAPRWICGSPTLRIGESIWGPLNGFKLGQVKSYKKMETSVTWKFKPKKGSADFSYDIWLTKNKGQSFTSAEKDLEIMVWLDYNFDVPWEKIGETANFIVKYEDKNKNKLARDKGFCVAFILKQKKDKFIFDILELVNFCSKHLKIDFKNYYIKSMDLINEFAKNTEVETKLYNLEFNFTK